MEVEQDPVGEPTPQELDAINNPNVIIEKPTVPQKATGKGDRQRWYTPSPVPKSILLRVTGMSNQQWNSAKGSVRSLFNAHHLMDRPNGKRIPWAKKNAKHKANAFRVLEEQFPVLQKCRAHWAADALFEAHWNYVREQVPRSSWIASEQLTD